MWWTVTSKLSTKIVTSNFEPPESGIHHFVNGNPKLLKISQFRNITAARLSFRHPYNAKTVLADWIIPLLFRVSYFALFLRTNSVRFRLLSVFIASLAPPINPSLFRVIVSILCVQVAPAGDAQYLFFNREGMMHNSSQWLEVMFLFEDCYNYFLISCAWCGIITSCNNVGVVVWRHWKDGRNMAVHEVRRDTCHTEGENGILQVEENDS